MTRKVLGKNNIKHMDKNDVVKIETRLKGIDIIKCSIHEVANYQSITNFNFNVLIDSRYNKNDNLLFNIVTVDITNEEQSVVYGSISVNCIFEITNSDEIMIFKENGLVEINNEVHELLNNISISTTRGVMFGTFKGTFLHQAYLPIFDLKNKVNLPKTTKKSKK